MRSECCISSRYIVALAVAAALSAGCSTEESAQPAAKQAAAAPQSVPRTKAETVIVKPDPAAAWKSAIEKARTSLAAKDLGAAEKAIAEVQAVYPDSKGTAEQSAELEQLQAEFNTAAQLVRERQRTEQIAEAQRLMDAGQFEPATKLLGEVVSNQPTDQQRETAQSLTTEIERRRRSRRDLQAWLNLLASSNRREVETAQMQLLKDPDTALSMLQEATLQLDKPALAANALESLGLLDRPQKTLPILVDVLRRDSHKELWPVAASEIVRQRKPGAGAALLELAAVDAPPDQRRSALTALARVVDPPPQTIITLWPVIAADGPLLPFALEAILHALVVHDQFDLAARRGLPANSGAPGNEALQKLPARLAEIVAAKDSAPDALQAARALQIALAQTPLVPLAGVKVHRAGAELPEGPAAAAIDGVWSSVDPKTMWRHAVSTGAAGSPSTITLDLGDERTVAAVKLWNFNEPGATFRGWKDVEVYVGSSPSETDPVAKGILPQAPGAAETPDYGAVISVPFVRGRYVRLGATSLWQVNAHTGLAEVQVLGF